MVDIATASMPHTDHCGITLLRGSSRPRTIAATDELPRDVDDLQYRLGEGPCLDASTRDTFALVEDLGSDERWRRFGPRCRDQTGVHSMLSVRLMLSGDDQAAMNFYAKHVGAFEDMDVAVASLFAPFVSIAVEGMLHKQDAENLRAALQSSRQIGTAVGIVMAQRLVTSEDAFAELREASSRLNRKLNDIAAEVERTGEIPGHAGRKGA